MTAVGALFAEVVFSLVYSRWSPRTSVSVEMLGKKRLDGMAYLSAGVESSSSAAADLKTVPSFAARIRAPHSDAETAGL
jgi:hypothetical protein